jgi:O-antigen/teichoic acid export membrane protein
LGQLRKTSILGSIIAIAGVALGFLNSGFLQPKLLNVDEIGVIRVILSIASIATIVTMFGFNSVLVKFYPTAVSSKDKRKLFKVYFLVTTIGLAIGLIGVKLYLQSFQTEIEYKYHKSAVYVYVAYFLLSSFASILNVLGKVNLVLLAKDVLIKFLFVSLLLVLIVFNKPVAWFINSFYAIYVLVAFLLLIVLVLSTKFLYVTNTSAIKESKSLLLKPMLSLGFFSFLSASTAIFIKELDILMVTELINLEATGIYAVMLFFAILVSVPSRALISISTVKIGQAWAEDNRKFLYDIYNKTANNQLFVAGFVMIMLNANVFIVLDIMPNGFKFTDGIWVMFWLSLAQFIDMASGVSGQLLYFSDKYRYGFYFSITLLICLIGFNYYFIPLYGISGAAFATFLSQLINNFLRWWFLKKRFQLQPFDKNFLIGLVVIIGLLIFSIWFRNFVEGISDILMVLILNGSIITLYAIVLIATEIAPDIKERLFVYLKKIKLK